MQRARWVVSQITPELAYGVSALAQGSKKKVLRQKAVSELIDRVHELYRQGTAKIATRPFPLDSLVVLTVVDASFAKEVGMKSQMGLLSLVADKGIIHGVGICNIVEFQSTTIARVVRSTMAAESASLSQAADRQL